MPGVSIMAGQTSSGGIPGDYNNNGTVGPEDFTIWKNTFGQSVTAGSGADGSGNSKVDAADYTVWRNRRNSASGSDCIHGGSRTVNRDAGGARARDGWHSGPASSVQMKIMHGSQLRRS